MAEAGYLIPCCWMFRDFDFFYRTVFIDNGTVFWFVTQAGRIFYIFEQLASFCQILLYADK